MQDSTIKTAFQETTIEADTWASESVGKFYGFPCPLVHIQNPKAMQTCIKSFIRKMNGTVGSA